ncbi:MAG: AGE family epimerase/isomerase [Bacilli bacterium]|nr:AGE family epimerase/isomerase [Bacilli bacterium]
MDIKKYLSLYETELDEYCAPFWLKYAVDEKDGGILNCVDEKGEVYSLDKSVWMQGRCGYMYSHLYNTHKKDPEYLKIAKSCIDFLDQHCFDADGRMYFTVTHDGLPLRKRRYYFSETFYIMANIEYYGATGDVEKLKNAKKVFDLVYAIYKDGANDPFQIWPKTYPTTRALKAMGPSMILLNVTYIMREFDKENEERYNAIIDECIAEIKLHYIPEYHAMLESITVDNKAFLDSAPERIINPGHDLECSFFLAQEAQYRNDKELLAFAELVFKDAIKNGWDETYGGILYFKDCLGKPVEAYEHDMKLWWPHNEGINASLLLFQLTGDKFYADWFEKITEYAFSHFSDHKYGEWYGYLRRDGKPTEPPCKGHTYKGPFHVMRCLNNVIGMLKEMSSK